MASVPWMSGSGTPDLKGILQTSRAMCEGSRRFVANTRAQTRVLKDRIDAVRLRSAESLDAVRKGSYDLSEKQKARSLQ